jgi:hypothetical protein
MRHLSTEQIIEVGKALLPYLRDNLSSAELGHAAHDVAAAFCKAKFGNVGLNDRQALAISCGNDPYADEEICPKCKGRGHVPARLKIIL